MHTMLADAMRTTDATYRESIEKLREALNAADAVVVGAGAGLSTAAGYAYGGERFHAHFADFEERFGIRDMYSGGFFPFPTRQEFWAFWSRMIWLNRYADDPKPTYQKLRQLLEGRDYFVITTNVDHRFQAAGFEKECLFYTQGDYGLFQCSKPCCQETFDNEKAVRAMLEQQEGMRVPEGLLPMCPHCGRPLVPNLRSDDTFVEDAGWHAAADRYHRFLREHRQGRVLYLELGVGYNTPVIIKYPFWRMTADNPEAVYACVNYGEAFCPEEIADRSVCLNADLDCVVGDLAGE